MKFVCIIVAVLAAALADAKVFVLDDNNFDKTLAENSPMLVEFYAPWCGHCKALEPEYEEADKILQGKKARVFLAKVDATAENAAQLSKRFGIQGFPTLKFFAKGSPDSPVIDYDGERKANNIVAWLEKKTGSPFTLISSTADLEKAKATVTADNEKIIVIGVFSEKEQATVFENVAKKDYARDFYAIIANAKLSSIVDAKASVPFVQVIRSFNLTNNAITTSAETVADAGKLEKFIAASSEPISMVVTYNDDDVANTVKQGFHAVEFYAPWCGYCKQFAPEYEKIAAYFLGEGAGTKVVVAKYDGTTNDQITENENIDSFPTLKLYKNGVAATYKGEMEKDSVIKFIQEKANVKASKIESEAGIDAFVADIPTALVGCVSEAHDSVIDTVAFQAADSSFKVGKLRCPKGKEYVDVYVSGRKRSSYPSSEAISDIAALRKWYKRASLNPVFKFDDAIFDEITGAEYKYVVFYFNNNLNGDEPEIKLFEQLVEKESFADTAFAYAGSSEEYLLQFFQVKGDSLPAVRLLDIKGSMKSYIGPDVVTEDSLSEMFDQLRDGSLEAVATPSDDEESGDDYEADNEEAENEDAEEGSEDEDFDGEEEDVDEEEEPQDEL